MDTDRYPWRGCSLQNSADDRTLVALIYSLLEPDSLQFST